MFKLLVLSGLLSAKAQLIGMKVCGGDVCATNCVSWTATSGRCYSCSNGPCSVTNPSSIVTSSYISLYSDSSCKNVIDGANKIPILMDAGCNVLLNNYNTRTGFSYSASNTSAIIGGAVSGGILIIGLITCICCICRRANKQQQQQAQDLHQEKQEHAANVPQYYPPAPAYPNNAYQTTAYQTTTYAPTPYQTTAYATSTYPTAYPTTAYAPTAYETNTYPTATHATSAYQTTEYGQPAYGQTAIPTYYPTNVYEQQQQQQQPIPSAPPQKYV